MEFTSEQWAGIKKHCEDKGLEFFASPFSVAAVNLLENLCVKRYKVGSGETTNLLMLDRIARTRKPIILSSGLSTFDELDQAVDFLRPFGSPLSILQCTTSYPTRASEIGLNVIGELKARYNVPIGFSDHSGTMFAPIAAVAHGAEMLEFHVVFDRRSFGPDSTSSIEVREIPELVRGVQYVAEAMATPIDKTEFRASSEMKRIFGKSLAVNADLPIGHRLQVKDLESKKPGDCGIPAKDFRRVVGRKLSRPMKAWDFLNHSDLSSEGEEREGDL
jgi:N-acetylneuraminate synthase